MDYFDFVDGLFNDQPSVLALRFSLVATGQTPDGEENVLWFVRDNDSALCVVGALAAGFQGHLSRIARKIADEHTESALRLLGEKSAAAEIRQVRACAPGRTQRLRGCFVSDGPYLVAADPEQGLASLEAGAEEDGAQSPAHVVMAGLSLEGTFERSVWLAAFCGETSRQLSEDLLFRYLATYYPIRFHHTPYHRWNREFGDQYWSGLPGLNSRFLGSMGPNPPQSGDPQRNIFWSKNRNSPLPAWRETCKRGTDDLLEGVRRRLTDLDGRSGGRIGPGPLIRWLETKGRGAAGSELDCAALLCACGTLATTDRIWLPLLCLLWRRDSLEKARDLEKALTDLLGQEARDLWRKFAEVAHTGYAIQAIIELREALSRVVGGLVSESIHYRSADGTVVQTIEISGVDRAIAETLAGEVIDVREKDTGIHRGIRLSAGPRSQLTTDLLRALRDMKDPKRGGIGDIATEYLPARAVLRIGIRLCLGSVR